MMKKFTPAIHDEKNLARIKRGKWKRGRKSRDPACILFLVPTVLTKSLLHDYSLKYNVQIGEILYFELPFNTNILSIQIK